MKYIRNLIALTFALTSLNGFAGDGWTTEEIGSNPSTGESLGRYVTLTKAGQIVYRRKEFLDPQLIGTNSSKYTETFYISGHGILRLDRFTDRLQQTFNSMKDFSIIVNSFSEESKLQIKATSLEEEKEYIWTINENGFFSDFQVNKLQFTEKQRALHKKLREIQP